MQHQLIFGTAGLHRLVTSRERQRAIAAAIDAGFAAFDLAPAYGNGIDEVEVGLALRGRRGDLRLNTKFGIPITLYGVSWRHAFAPRRVFDQWLRQSARAYRTRDFSPRELTRSVEGSLRRLRTDHLDCLFLHEPLTALSAVQLDDAVASAARLKTAGTIRAFGVAGPVDSVLLCPSLDAFDVVQTRCADVLERPGAVGDRPLILYGLHAAHRTGAEPDFRRFVRGVLAMREGTRAILASRQLDTIRSFRGITA